MNILFDYRVTLHFTICENIDETKLIKSIKKLSRSNRDIFIIGECKTSDVNDNCIYFTIQNNNLEINFSHIHYDGYSVWLVCQKIDQIYKNEVKNYTFQIYDVNYSKIKIFTNTIKILPKVNIKHIYNVLTKNKHENKTKIKILKTNFNEISTKEVIRYLVDKLELKEYYLILNARKTYNEYEDVLGNLVYFSGKLNIKDDIRTNIQKNKNESLEKKLNATAPNGLLVNSYLNFTLPSFIKHFIPPVPCANYIVIHPVNNNKKYILVDYYRY
jgi:hypothetical protein